jgi:hypothetical protein
LACAVRIDLQEIIVNADNEVRRDEFHFIISSCDKTVRIRRNVPSNVIHPFSLKVNKTLLYRIFDRDEVNLSFEIQVKELDPFSNDTSDIHNLGISNIPCQNPLTMNVFRRVTNPRKDLDATVHLVINIEPIEDPISIRQLVRLIINLLDD